MPITNKSILLIDRVYTNSHARCNGTKNTSSYVSNETKKIYYNAGNPNLSYSNNAYSISISQPSGNNMITGVGWLD